ncbi:MAG: hypothetical protein IZT58_15280 [Actinobacteria bacterium]|nr:hypothetical protein [Actinomycetota bacterium]
MIRHRRPWRLALLGASLLLSGLIIPGSTAAVEPLTVISAGATALERAVRLEPAVRPGAACRRVWVVGDSLTVASSRSLRLGLAGLGVEYVVDGAISRRVNPGGISAVRAIRTASGEADCWVIALGSNDIYVNAARPITRAYASSVIETMTAELSPGARVWWVNINVRDSSTNIVSSGVMNSSLGDRDLADPDFAVIDWYTLSQSNPTWFANDNLHYNSAGYRARADQIVEAIRRNGER